MSNKNKNENRFNKPQSDDPTKNHNNNNENNEHEEIRYDSPKVLLKPLLILLSGVGVILTLKATMMIFQS